jgi:hypothetical protein
VSRFFFVVADIASPFIVTPSVMNMVAVQIKKIESPANRNATPRINTKEDNITSLVLLNLSIKCPIGITKIRSDASEMVGIKPARNTDLNVTTISHRKYTANALETMLLKNLEPKYL